MSPRGAESTASAWRLVVAFAAIYSIWGSTYLAIRVGVETLPPFLMAGGRFLLAGSLLYIGARRRGAVPPTLRQWRNAAIVGGFLLLGANGLVTWSEQYIPSGIAALLIASVPFWMTLLDPLFFGGPRPTGFIYLGLVSGFLGVAILVAPTGASVRSLDPWGTLGVLVAAVSWATGSLIGRKIVLPREPLLAAAMEMFAAGALLLVLGSVAGEWARFELGAVSVRSFLAVSYLVVFGSLVGFSAYVWLLRHTTPALISTYAFVNPVVAVFLGWLVLHEELEWRTGVAAALVVGAVAAIQWGRHRAFATAHLRERKPALERPLSPVEHPIEPRVGSVASD